MGWSGVGQGWAGHGRRREDEGDGGGKERWEGRERWSVGLVLRGEGEGWEGVREDGETSTSTYAHVGRARSMRRGVLTPAGKEGGGWESSAAEGGAAWRGDVLAKRRMIGER